MKRSVNILLIITFLLLSLYSHAQEALGIVNSNYSGINSLWINPANASGVRSTISLNLLAGDGFFVSNYFYVHKKDYRFLKIFKVDMNDPQYLYTYNYPEYSYIDSVHYLDYYKNSKFKNLYFNGRIAGPSLLFRIGDHSFSLLTAFRNNFSGSVIPYNVMNFAYRGLDYEPQHHITYDEKPFDLAMLSWIELGAGYSYTFFNDGQKKLSAGFTLKYLLGTGASYGTVKDITYMVPYQDTLIVYDMNSEIGLSLPVDYATNDFSLDPVVRGRGFSADIGFVYQQMAERPSRSGNLKESENPWEENYRFRAGISLLDIGRIKFTENAEVHKYENVTNRIWPGLIDYQATSIRQFFRSASYNFLGDSLASLSDQTSFRMWLPTALSAQFDYNFGNGIYANATFVQGICLGKPGVRRESLIALTPRYETPLWEVNLPVSLVDFRNPAIGLSLRIYSLVIGTEKLGTFLHLTDVKGMDFYFSLSINLTPKGEKITGGVSKGRYSGGRGKSCESIREYKRFQIR